VELACSLFAELLDYPTERLARQARACGGLVSGTCPEASALLDAFCDLVQGMPVGRLEEIYTRTFDLQSVCYPYVGYHLVGESYQRGAFLARLAEGYRAQGFSAGQELPDHICVVLRFLSLGSDGDRSFATVLLHEGLVPALARMVACFDGESGNPYALAIRALWLLLGGQPDGRSGPERAAWQGHLKGWNP
jgi:nitrate reductase delta subunit